MIFVDNDAYERVFREAVSLVNGICKQAKCKKDILAKRHFDDDEWYALRVQLKDGKPDGVCQFLYKDWEEDDLTGYKLAFKNGRLDGTCEMYKIGMSMRSRFKDGLLEGQSITTSCRQKKYYTSFNLARVFKGIEKGTYDFDELFLRSDNVKCSAMYKSNVLDGPREIYGQFGLEQRDVYSNGQNMTDAVRTRFKLDEWSEMAFLSYQPIQYKDGWLQLDIEGKPRFFKDNPSNIQDEVNQIAEKMSRSLRFYMTYDIGMEGPVTLGKYNSLERENAISKIVDNLIQIDVDKQKVALQKNEAADLCDRKQLGVKM